MNSDRRGFFKKLFGLGAMVVGGQAMPSPIQAAVPVLSEAAPVLRMCGVAEFPMHFVGYSQVVETSEMTVSYTMPRGEVYSWVEVKNIGGKNG